MRELNIAYGNNRQAKRWVNKTIRFDDLKERLRVPIRTTESAEEYAKMSRAQRDAAKDPRRLCGGRSEGRQAQGRYRGEPLDGGRLTVTASTPLFWKTMSPSAPIPPRCTPPTAARRKIPVSGWCSH